MRKILSLTLWMMISSGCSLLNPPEDRYLVVQKDCIFYTPPSLDCGMKQWVRDHRKTLPLGIKIFIHDTRVNNQKYYKFCKGLNEPPEDKCNE